MCHPTGGKTDQVLCTAGGLSLTRTLAMQLFSRLGEFNPYAIYLVLQNVHPPHSLPVSSVSCNLFILFWQALRYSPDENDLYDILNVLEDRLRSNNPSIIFAVLQAFLHLTEVSPLTLTPALHSCKALLPNLITLFCLLIF